MFAKVRTSHLQHKEDSILATVKGWLMPLLKKGRKEDLTTDDLYEVETEDSSSALCDRMEKYWNEERARAAKKGAKASYAWALIRCFGCRYFTVGILAAVEECVLRIGQPVLLGFLIRNLSGYPGLDERWMSWVFATGIVMCSFIYILTHHPFFFGIQRIGMQIRIGSCAMIFRKSLRLSKAALANTTVGQMVNLLSNDVNRFDTSVVFLNYLWVGPLQLAIVTVILWYLLGVACFAGLIVIVLFIPLQSLMGKVFSRLRLQTAQRTDSRVRVMNEIVNAMRVIKMYAWEYPFADLIKKYRRSEIDVVMRTNYCRAVNMSLFFTSAKLVVFLALLTYVLTGNILTAEKVFVTTALIQNIRLSMTLFFPMAISMGSETLISCQRLQEFFELEELDDSPGIDHTEDIGPNETAGVEIRDLTAKWTEEGAMPTLSGITASVQAGELLAIVGPVGAGKGSLLHCILGELPTSQGSVLVRGKVAYASQEPWLFSGTVRQNIIFGRPYDEKKYGEVIKVCGLEADLEQLPEGDLSLVGERGTSLSGGQKARVNLARAVYLEGDVVLLDDPLSAVDTVVGRHLFRRCIRTHLRSKAVILVTHQLQYIRAADNILVLKEGRCEAVGTYNQLVNKGLDFTSLLQEEKEDTSQAGSISVTPAHVAHKNIVNSIRRGSESSRGGSFRSIGSGSLRRRGDEVPLYESALSIAGSMQSVNDDCLENVDEAKSKQLEEKSPDDKKYNELRSTGAVTGKIYLKYFLNAGHWILCLLLVFLNIATQVVFSSTDYWLSYWTNGEQLRGYVSSDGNTTYNSTDVPPGYLDTKTNIIVYTSLVGSLFVLSMCRTVLFFVMCMRSSRRLHNKMFAAVIRVPIQYFDTHPIDENAVPRMKHVLVVLR
ncbi:ABC transporter type 1 transmembrane domain [Trinorchestia longiramus]|nr:ABC transporter type 1 transmembrane domain [Trinorchestia longiramus]